MGGSRLETKRSSISRTSGGGGAACAYLLHRSSAIVKAKAVPTSAIIIEPELALGDRGSSRMYQ